jgi:hypothetical protein
MNLRHILTIINIASLLKSSHAGFIEVGQGTCEALNGHPYDYAGSYEGQTNNITAASDWCLSAVNYTSGLVGINLSPSWEYWTCLYDNGSIDNIQKTDFKPDAEFTSKDDECSDCNGRGAVVGADGNTAYTCYKNEVRVELIPAACFISYLLSWRLLIILSYCIRIMCRPTPHHPRILMLASLKWEVGNVLMSTRTIMTSLGYLVCHLLIRQLKPKSMPLLTGASWQQNIYQVSLGYQLEPIAEIGIVSMKMALSITSKMNI